MWKYNQCCCCCNEHSSWFSLTPRHINLAISRPWHFGFSLHYRVFWTGITTNFDSESENKINSITSLAGITYWWESNCWVISHHSIGTNWAPLTEIPPVTGWQSVVFFIISIDNLLTWMNENLQKCIILLSAHCRLEQIVHIHRLPSETGEQKIAVISVL